MGKHKKLIALIVIYLMIIGIIYSKLNKNLPTYFEYNPVNKNEYSEYYKLHAVVLEELVENINTKEQSPRIQHIRKICEIHLSQNKSIPSNWMSEDIRYSQDALFELMLVNEMYKDYSSFDNEKKEIFAHYIIGNICIYYLGITSNLITPQDYYSQYAALICVEAMEKEDKKLVKFINDPFEVFNNKPIDAGLGMTSSTIASVPHQYKGMTTEDYKAFVRLFKLWCWNTASQTRNK